MTEVKKKKDDDLYATGKRKRSIARVRLRPGSGKILVNRNNFDQYFHQNYAPILFDKPFITGGVSRENFDIIITVHGGGFNGQIEAIFYGIAKAMGQISEEVRKKMRVAGFLTVDNRKVESKKYGRKKARKSFQFSKR